jgi:hypothetical protein
LRAVQVLLIVDLKSRSGERMLLLRIKLFYGRIQASFDFDLVVFRHNRLP